MTPLERILAKLPDAKPSGEGYAARCPAHNDRRASLSLCQGDNGGAVLHCHAGCETPAVVAAVGLTMADLMPANADNVNGIPSTPAHRRVSLTSTTQASGRSFTTAHGAVMELEREHGPRSAIWTYHNERREPVGVIVRWDLSDGKKAIRPVSRHGDEWKVGGMPEPRPLFGLPDLDTAKCVCVCEGEKAAEAARSIGLIATTSAHGAASCQKTDWQPLAGKEIVILPDHDDAGRKYAEGVATILASLTPACTIKVVDLPGLPEGGDFVEWIDAHGDAAEPAAMRMEIEALADAAEPWQSVVADDRVAADDQAADFEPFPVDSLPEPVRSFVNAGAKAIGCDSSYLALPLLTVVASAIGNTRRLRLKRGWDVPPTLWTAILGESGTSKTPAFQLAMRSIRERQKKSLERHDEAMRQHEVNLARWDKAYVEWRRNGEGSDEPPEKPCTPEAERLVVSDVTIEAVAPLLLASPRGLLLARDELSGWVASFDRYSGGKGGGDAAHWLSTHNGESLIVDRKTGDRRTIYVPQASVCVCGGVQPAILHRVIGHEHRESGLAARILFACPPRQAKRWTDADVDPAAEAELARVVNRLFELQPIVNDADEPEPVIVGLSNEAKAAWKVYFNDHGREQADLAGELSAAWSKLEEAAARPISVVAVRHGLHPKYCSERS